MLLDRQKHRRFQTILRRPRELLAAFLSGISLKYSCSGAHAGFLPPIAPRIGMYIVGNIRNNAIIVLALNSFLFTG